MPPRYFLMITIGNYSCLIKPWNKFESKAADKDRFRSDYTLIPYNLLSRKHFRHNCPADYWIDHTPNVALSQYPTYNSHQVLRGLQATERSSRLHCRMISGGFHLLQACLWLGLGLGLVTMKNWRFCLSLFCSFVLMNQSQACKCCRLTQLF